MMRRPRLDISGTGYHLIAPYVVGYEVDVAAQRASCLARVQTQLIHQ